MSVSPSVPPSDVSDGSGPGSGDGSSDSGDDSGSGSSDDGTTAPTPLPTSHPTVFPTTSRPTTSEPTTSEPTTSDPTELPTAAPTVSPTTARARCDEISAFLDGTRAREDRRFPTSLCRLAAESGACDPAVSPDWIIINNCQRTCSLARAGCLGHAEAPTVGWTDPQQLTCEEIRAAETPVWQCGDSAAGCTGFMVPTFTDLHDQAHCIVAARTGACSTEGTAPNIGIIDNCRLTCALVAAADASTDVGGRGCVTAAQTCHAIVHGEHEVCVPSPMATTPAPPPGNSSTTAAGHRQRRSCSMVPVLVDVDDVATCVAVATSTSEADDCNSAHFHTCKRTCSLLDAGCTLPTIPPTIAPTAFPTAPPSSTPTTAEPTPAPTTSEPTCEAVYPPFDYGQWSAWSSECGIASRFRSERCGATCTGVCVNPQSKLEHRNKCCPGIAVCDSVVAVNAGNGVVVDEITDNGYTLTAIAHGADLTLNAIFTGIRTADIARVTFEVDGITFTDAREPVWSLPVGVEGNSLPAGFLDVPGTHRIVVTAHGLRRMVLRKIELTFHVVTSLPPSSAPTTTEPTAPPTTMPPTTPSPTTPPPTTRAPSPAPTTWPTSVPSVSPTSPPTQSPTPLPTTSEPSRSPTSVCYEAAHCRFYGHLCHSELVRSVCPRTCGICN